VSTTNGILLHVLQMNVVENHTSLKVPLRSQYRSWLRNMCHSMSLLSGKHRWACRLLDEADVLLTIVD
jgi:hypothetical protein